MLLPELQSMASSLGISGTGRMRKGELIAAIQERQAGEGRVPGPREVPARVEAPREEVRETVDRPAATGESNGGAATGGAATGGAATSGDGRGPRRATRPAGPPEH